MVKVTSRTQKEYQAHQEKEKTGPRTVTVEVPEWGGPVTLRALSDEERHAIPMGKGEETDVYYESKDALLHRARVVVLAAVDEAGEPVFSESDVPAMVARSRHAVERLAGLVIRFSGTSATDEPTRREMYEPNRLYFRLALDLRMTVADLFRRMSGWELEGWHLYYDDLLREKLDVAGEEFAELRAKVEATWARARSLGLVLDDEDDEDGDLPGDPDPPGRFDS